MPLSAEQIKNLASEQQYQPGGAYTADQLTRAYLSGEKDAVNDRDLLATSQSSRAETASNTLKLDGKIAQASAYVNPNPYGVGVDGKPIEDPNKTGAPMEVSQPLQTGYKWVYHADGTKFQIRQEDMAAKYGALDNPPAPAGPTGPTTAQTQFDGVQSEQNAQAQAALANMERAQKNADATMSANLEMIKQMYIARKQKMEDINKRFLAGKQIAGIASGRNRYAMNIDQGLLSTEEMDGQQRLAELDAEEMNLIMKAKQARDEASVKAFNDYMTQIDRLNADKIDVISRLHQMAMDADKALLDKQKAEKENVLDKTRLADSIAPAALEQYDLLKTPEEKAAFLEKLAAQYGVDANMIRSSMMTYADEADKEALDREFREQQISTEKAQQANYYSQIADRKDEGGGGGTAKDEWEQIDTAFTYGFTGEGGQKFNGRGDDGYVDPYLYLAIYNGFATLEEKNAFLKKFPPAKHINPDFPQEELPSVIRVKLNE